MTDHLKLPSAGYLDEVMRSHLGGEPEELNWPEAERKAIGKVMRWRPIETAPKDMSPILLFEPGSRIGGVQEEFDRIVIGFRKHTGFVLQEDDHLGVNATHWMPLPEPPQEKAASPAKD